MATVVKQCSCKSEFQDNLYGKNMRLKNQATKGENCTICGGGHKLFRKNKGK